MSSNSNNETIKEIFDKFDVDMRFAKCLIDSNLKPIDLAYLSIDQINQFILPKTAKNKLNRFIERNWPKIDRTEIKKLIKICRQMLGFSRQNNFDLTLQLKPRVSNRKRVQNTFFGIEFVNQLVNNMGNSREAAFEIGQNMLRNEIIEHLGLTNQFFDDYENLYIFTKLNVMRLNISDFEIEEASESSLASTSSIHNNRTNKKSQINDTSDHNENSNSETEIKEDLLDLLESTVKENRSKSSRLGQQKSKSVKTNDKNKKEDFDIEAEAVKDENENIEKKKSSKSDHKKRRKHSDKKKSSRRREEGEQSRRKSKRRSKDKEEDDERKSLKSKKKNIETEEDTKKEKDEVDVEDMLGRFMMPLSARKKSHRIVKVVKVNKDVIKKVNNDLAMLNKIKKLFIRNSGLAKKNSQKRSQDKDNPIQCKLMLNFSKNIFDLKNTDSIECDDIFACIKQQYINGFLFGVKEDSSEKNAIKFTKLTGQKQVFDRRHCSSLIEEILNTENINQTFAKKIKRRLSTYERRLLNWLIDFCVELYLNSDKNNSNLNRLSKDLSKILLSEELFDSHKFVKKIEKLFFHLLNDVYEAQNKSGKEHSSNKKPMKLKNDTLIETLQSKQPVSSLPLNDHIKLLHNLCNDMKSEQSKNSIFSKKKEKFSGSDFIKQFKQRTSKCSDNTAIDIGQDLLNQKMISHYDNDPIFNNDSNEAYSFVDYSFSDLKKAVKKKQSEEEFKNKIQQEDSHDASQSLSTSNNRTSISENRLKKFSIFKRLKKPKTTKEEPRKSVSSSSKTPIKEKSGESEKNSSSKVSDIDEADDLLDFFAEKFVDRTIPKKPRKILTSKRIAVKSKKEELKSNVDEPLKSKAKLRRSSSLSSKSFNDEDVENVEEKKIKPNLNKAKTAEDLQDKEKEKEQERGVGVVEADAIERNSEVKELIEGKSENRERRRSERKHRHHRHRRHKSSKDNDGIDDISEKKKKRRHKEGRHRKKKSSIEEEEVVVDEERQKEQLEKNEKEVEKERKRLADELLQKKLEEERIAQLEMQKKMEEIMLQNELLQKNLQEKEHKMKLQKDAEAEQILKIKEENEKLQQDLLKKATELKGKEEELKAKKIEISSTNALLKSQKRSIQEKTSLEQQKRFNEQKLAIQRKEEQERKELEKRLKQRFDEELVKKAAENEANRQNEMRELEEQRKKLEEIKEKREKELMLMKRKAEEEKRKFEAGEARRIRERKEQELKMQMELEREKEKRAKEIEARYNKLVKETLKDFEEKSKVSAVNNDIERLRQQLSEIDDYLDDCDLEENIDDEKKKELEHKRKEQKFLEFRLCHLKTQVFVRIKNDQGNKALTVKDVEKLDRSYFEQINECLNFLEEKLIYVSRNFRIAKAKIQQDGDEASLEAAKHSAELDGIKREIEEFRCLIKLNKEHQMKKPDKESDELLSAIRKRGLRDGKKSDSDSDSDTIELQDKSEVLKEFLAENDLVKSTVDTGKILGNISTSQQTSNLSLKIEKEMVARRGYLSRKDEESDNENKSTSSMSSSDYNTDSESSDSDDEDNCDDKSISDIDEYEVVTDDEDSNASSSEYEYVEVTDDEEDSGSEEDSGNLSESEQSMSDNSDTEQDGDSYDQSSTDDNDS